MAAIIYPLAVYQPSTNRYTAILLSSTMLSKPIFIIVCLYCLQKHFLYTENFFVKSSLLLEKSVIQYTYKIKIILLEVNYEHEHYQ